MQVQTRGWETYAFHGSTGGILPISNLLIRRFQKARLRFLHGVLSKRNHGSLKGPEERANVGHLFVTDHLQGMYVCHREKRTEHEQQTLDLVCIIFKLVKGNCQRE
jgi:hypothetical protein